LEKYLAQPTQLMNERKNAMSVEISLRLPESSFSILKIKPDDFAKEMLMAATVKWYEMELISQSKAAELAGLSRQQFMEALYRFNVSPYQLTIQELQQECIND